MTKLSSKFTSGCYFDSHRGFYIGEAVIELAESLGMPKDEEMNPDHEYYLEAWIDAEDWLNAHCAEEGFYWGNTDNGDFGYWPIEEDN